MGAHDTRSVRGEPFERWFEETRRALRVRRAVGARKLGARKCEILGLPARALGVIAAEKVAQAVRHEQLADELGSTRRAVETALRRARRKLAAQEAFAA